MGLAELTARVRGSAVVVLAATILASGVGNPGPANAKSRATTAATKKSRRGKKTAALKAARDADVAAAHTSKRAAKATASSPVVTARAGGASAAKKTGAHAAAMRMAKKGTPRRATRTASRSKRGPSSRQFASVHRPRRARSVGAELPSLTDGPPVLTVAASLLGSPYRFGGTAEQGFDCSGFVQTVYSTVGVDLPRSARDQFTLGERVSDDELQPGDLVFFHTYRRYASHVGIYAGEGKFIHAATRGGAVRVDLLDDPYYEHRYLGARRMQSL